MAVTGFVPPIPTPLHDGRLDRQSLQRLVHALAPYVAGYLVGGSVGEYPSLTVEERLAALHVVAGSKLPRHRLVASIGDNALPNVRALAEGAVACGADLLVLGLPNYFANTRAGLIAYLRAVASFTGCELCLYDNPVASHTPLSVADILALAAAEPKLTHVKVTDLTLDKVAALRAQTNVTVHSGDDAVLWGQLTRGAHGAMVALPLIYPALAANVWTALQRGDVEEAARAYQPASHFIHVALGAPDYVVVLKTVLASRDVIASDEVRLPLLALDRARRAEVLAALDLSLAISPRESEPADAS
jgi:4-hydroxy-tetrahydrodipicolinate synthase